MVLWHMMGGSTDTSSSSSLRISPGTSAARLTPSTAAGRLLSMPVALCMGSVVCCMPAVQLRMLPMAGRLVAVPGLVWGDAVAQGCHLQVLLVAVRSFCQVRSAELVHLGMGVVPWVCRPRSMSKLQHSSRV